MTTPALTATAEDLDAMILRCATEDWQKVAMVIAKSFDAGKDKALEVTAHLIAERIYALADAKKLESKGNIRRWRTSEVRRCEKP